jgi:cell division septation protein DedD
MCLACEQDAIWLAYLDSQGLLKPDDPAAVEALFSSFPVQELPVQPDSDKPTPEAPAGAAPKPAAKNPFTCDDPTA